MNVMFTSNWMATYIVISNVSSFTNGQRVID